MATGKEAQRGVGQLRVGAEILRELRGCVPGLEAYTAVAQRRIKFTGLYGAPHCQDSFEGKLR